MTLKETIKADLTTAMKARDEMTTSTLRMVLSAITNAEVAGDQAVTLDDNQTIAVLQSEAKSAPRPHRSTQMRVAPRQQRRKRPSSR